ncbi:MAG: glycerol-3-phosphate 1-O-acyltransferase PlsY [Kiritimatiellae bacterium]|nr:glycerol-3-phosphate 1-O-acyltransferase PlsY [Kiritimatiellia bacterium]
MDYSATVAWAGAAAGYLAGSIPFGLLLARLVGVDVRKVGSGNIGATNVFRINKGLGVLAFLLDALKGFAPAFAARWVAGAPEWLGLAWGAAAVAGHNWPLWLGFKGGKGVSTSVGMLLGVAPAAAGIGLGVFAVTVVATRWVSLGSILAAAAVAGCAWWLYGSGQPPVVAWALTVLAALVILRHWKNILRLLHGTEPKIIPKKSSSGTAGAPPA